MRRLILLACLLIGGCASPPAPYAQLGLEWQVDRMSDWMLQPERDWMGDSPYLTGRAGLEWKNQYSCELSTSTSLFTGAPFK